MITEVRAKVLRVLTDNCDKRGGLRPVCLACFLVSVCEKGKIACEDERMSIPHAHIRDAHLNSPNCSAVHAQCSVGAGVCVLAVVQDALDSDRDEGNAARSGAGQWCACARLRLLFFLRDMLLAA